MQWLMIGPHRGWLALAAAAILSVSHVGCHPADERPRKGPRASELLDSGPSQIVSTVDRSGITLREVEELVLAGLAPEESLRRLQAQSLLMLEAERRGLQERRMVQQLGRQAAVQALLEREAQAVTVTETQLREAYAAQAPRFQLPERRVAAHVMARLREAGAPEAEKVARKFAEDAIDGLSKARDLDAFLQQQKAQSVPGVEIIAERLPEVARSSIPGPFGDAVFESEGTGVIKRPIRSKQGWHAIRVIAILPEEARVTFEQASAELRPELLLQQRAKRLEELIAQLRKQVPVSVAPDALKQLAAVGLE